MKKRLRKLFLHRETLHHLEHPALGGVLGGNEVDTRDADSWCPDTACQITCRLACYEND